MMKRLLTGFSIAFALLIVYVIVVTRVSAPVLDDGPITVSQGGAAYQGPLRVGIAAHEQGMQTLKLLLVSPANSQAPVSPKITLIFAGSAQSVAKAEFISVQGTNGMYMSWTDDHTLVLNLNNVSPESYTQLFLTLPPGFFHLPIAVQLRDFFVGILITGWVTLALLIVSGTFLLCRLRITRESWAVSPVSSEEAASHFNPLEMGLLHHGAIEASDLLALLYDLAERGYLQLISHEDHEVSFLRTRKTEFLNSVELNFLLILFPEENSHARLTAILQTLDRELFSAVVSQFYVTIYDGFAEKGFFSENPRVMHLRYKTVAIALQFCGLLVSTLWYFFFLTVNAGPIFLGVGMYMAGVILFMATYQFRPFSPAGRDMLKMCAAFQAFLTRPDPISLEGANNLLFYRYLPYAVSLKCLSEWQNRFVHTAFAIPDWYMSDTNLALSDTFVTQAAEDVDLLAELLVRVKDPNVD